jgi:hypothetical protein
MGRRFRHLDEEWEVEALGMAHGVGVGEVPQLTDWGVEFRCISNPSKGPYRADVHRPDLSKVSEDELKRTLEHAAAKAQQNQDQA